MSPNAVQELSGRGKSLTAVVIIRIAPIQTNLGYDNQYSKVVLLWLHHKRL